ncbi:MAG: metal ABC transporter permease [Peptoniphilaceae bacterium]
MIDFSILTSYSFLVVAIGTIILAISAGSIGCITVLKGQSLIGDAIGHSSFPGVVIAFMLFMQKDPVILLLGAITTGTIAYIFINVVDKNSKLDLDAILAVTLSSFFGLGMVLKSYIQGNPKFASSGKAALQNYIFGQAAYMMKKDVLLIFIISILAIISLIIFYKEIKLFVFDEVYAQTIGMNTNVVNGIILIITMGIIAVGLKIVGAILISSLLIVPAITALQWSKKFKYVILISALVGTVSAFVGTYLSAILDGFGTGPSIILVMTIIAFISLIFGPHGMISNYKMRRKYR